MLSIPRAAGLHRIAAVAVIFLADVNPVIRTVFCEAFMVGVPRVVHTASTAAASRYERVQQHHHAQEKQFKRTRTLTLMPAPRARGATRSLALAAG